MPYSIAILAGLVTLCGSVLASDEPKGGKAVSVPGVWKFKMKGLDGKEVDLARYQGKVVLIVNVASKCGYTPQYEGLQALYETYKKEGLVILGVPSNDFGKQEPGTNEEIAAFCKKNYGVTFDMLAKVPVKGEEQAPLYKYLTSKETNPHFAGPIEWNFTKFLIGRKGEIVGRYAHKVKPDDDDLVQAIKTELAKK